MNLEALIEPVAVATGITCVALTVRQRILNWPIGIVSSALFLLLFVRSGLYADSALQGLYIALGFYGWWHWLNGGPARDNLPVTTAPARRRIALVLVAAAGTVALGAFLDRATDSTVPYAATTVLSVTAQLLLTRKLIETWPVWIFGVNIPYVAIYLYKGLAMTAALQFVFIALSLAGWAAWRRSMAETPLSPETGPGAGAEATRSAAGSTS
jgi:nicotinamide mononucleotide transporter